MHSSPSRQARSWLLSLGAVLVALTPLAAQDDEPDYPRLAPYADIVWEGAAPPVRYLEANDPPFEAALAALRDRARDGISTDSLGIELERVIGLFIDGHAGISGHERGDRFLPFVVDIADEGRFVAVHAGTGGPLDPEHPYLDAIDGRPLRAWLEAADPYVPRGSAQYREHMRARLLRDAGFIRAELGTEASDSLTVTLSDAGGESVERTLPLADERPRYAEWPVAESRILEGDVGYLRIPAMDDDAVETIREWMPRFADTRGLVIDVRRNGGGSRDALLELFP